MIQICKNQSNTGEKTLFWLKSAALNKSLRAVILICAWSASKLIFFGTDYKTDNLARPMDMIRTFLLMYRIEIIFFFVYCFLGLMLYWML